MKGSVNSATGLSFKRKGDSSFNANQQIVGSYSGNGDWQAVVLPVANSLSWNDIITEFRLDLLTSVSTTAEVDWIEVSDGDFDNDGISDSTEGYGDLDGDGLCNFEDLDTDDDGLPDRLENIYGISRTVKIDKLLDTDGDGVTDYNEVIAGTNMNNRNSRLNHSIMMNPNQTSITFDAIPERVYVVERSPDLVSWEPIGTYATQNTQFITHVDNRPNWRSCLYRIAISLNPSIAQE
jgi:hypothetical protein